MKSLLVLRSRSVLLSGKTRSAYNRLVQRSQVCVPSQHYTMQTRFETSDTKVKKTKCHKIRHLRQSDPIPTSKEYGTKSNENDDHCTKQYRHLHESVVFHDSVICR